jgi:hypothetical protein
MNWESGPADDVAHWPIEGEYQVASGDTEVDPFLVGFSDRDQTDCDEPQPPTLEGAGASWRRLNVDCDVGSSGKRTDEVDVEEETGVTKGLDDVGGLLDFSGGIDSQELVLGEWLLLVEPNARGQDRDNRTIELCTRKVDRGLRILNCGAAEEDRRRDD